MYRLSLKIAFLVLLAFGLHAQSPHGKGFKMDCAKCHDSGSWTFSSKSKFEHGSTGFQLSGGHKNINCNTCHTKLDFVKTSPNCVSCHTDMHNQTVGNDCARCHTTQSWIVENITKLHEQTSFPLSGVHKTVDCNQCHKTETNIRFNPIGQTCVDCHTKDFKESVNPNHVKLNLSTDCASCHSTTVAEWASTTFPDHDKFYPLTGAHAAIAKDCEKCHIGGNFNNTPTECVGCHKTDFNKATNPNHAKLNLSSDCASCHTTASGWSPATFPVHNDFYPLTGAHTAIANNCAECHKGDYNNTPNDCNSCHNTDYKKTNNPNHSTLNLSTDCASCHTTAPDWSPATFTAHNDFYPLTGAHSTLKCSECHKGGNYTNTPKDCNACHNVAFKTAKSPNHEALGFSTDCATCHTTSNGWKPTTFDHNKFYPLTGAHATIANDCNKCHNGSNYKNPPTDCIACHFNNYKSAKSPNHVDLGLSTDCVSCHTTNSGWKPSTFNHSTYYPLTGAHASIANDCIKCHAGGVSNTSKDCNSCHNANYKSAQNPNHATLGLSTDCASCHSTNAGWKPTTFNHNNYYPLTGAHATIANDCIKCHAGGVNNTSTDCNSCHNTAYNSAKNPNHAAMGMSTDCASCHTTKAGWSPTTFDHNKFYPLTGAHASIANDCNKCHNGSNYKKPPTDCNSCHNANYKSAQNPNHATLVLSTDCASCHSTNAGWKPTTFNHNNYYPLTGAHATIANDCIKCHAGGVNNTSTDCNSCHNTAYNSAKNPNHAAMGMSTDCASCHTTKAGWSPTTFDHNKFYPLTGAHASIANDCNKCHNGSNYKKPPTDCNSCHNANYKSAQNPNHATLGLSTDCASCHSTNAGWKPTTFNHNNYYPLTGAHATIANDCIKCHAGGVNNTSTDCNSCHNTAYNSAKNPNHAAMGMSTDCASCHTTNAGWRPTTFDHSKFYPLTGAHASIANDCNKCHATGVKNTPTDCNACHNANYRSAQSPNHVTLGLSTDCASCHSTNSGWRPTTFNHNNYYPLTGGHASIANDCIKCHAGGVKNTPTDCNACHSNTFNAAQNPNHVTSGFSRDCASCHTTAPGWRPSTFNHNNIYPLTGAHANIASNCTKCHIGGNFNNTPTDCNACHNANYRSAQSPNHATLGLSTDCASCHSTNSGWRPTTFNHNNYYPLTGGHASIANDCIKCHAGGVKNTPTDCNACHSNTFNAAQNPNHVTSGFSRDCASCHTTAPGWRPSTFNHNNIYPLTGAHANIASNCTQCHIGGNFNNTPNTCNGCHSSAYNGANNPNHVASGFSRDCASCHTTAPSWRPSTFNHNNFYPLVGAHARIASNCTQCHIGGNYNNTPNTCIGCHTADYNRATPNHRTSGFPTNCTSCHSQNAWRPATWNHDTQYFPIYSGKHRGEWNNCNECHTTAGNFSIFNCLNCHKKTDTDKDHKKVNGYSYDSNSCYACHPDGND